MLDRSAINDEISRGVLSVVVDVASDEPRTFLVGGELATGDAFRERANPLKGRLGVLRAFFVGVNP